MTRNLSKLATLAIILTACAPDGGDGAVTRDAFTVPDDWDCAHSVFEAGGFRTLGDDEYAIAPGAQTAGTARIYYAVDGAYDAIATVKSGITSFTWTSTVPIRAVISSAGAGRTTIFDYRLAPQVAGYGVYAVDAASVQLAPTSLRFCFDAPPPICQ